ncbi:MAG: UDP-glucuronic acid decarboxylase family protein [Planctomycetota bacterium]
MHRIAVTGGAGFIGSHLCRRLHSDGHEVICIDNCYSGRKANIADLIGSPRFEFVRHDIVFPLFLEVDRVYHLACPASPIHYQHNPIKTIKANAIGTLNMLGLAKRVHARFLQTSTSEVYGDPDVHPQVESYRGNVNTWGPRACYDEGKRVAESLCWCYEQEHSLAVRVARIFNTYGPTMQFNDGRVVSNFIVQSLQDKPLTLYGDGRQTRSFCFVSDMVDGLMRLMESDVSGPVNLGNPVELTIRDLAERVNTAVAARKGRDPLELVFEALPEDDPTRRCPDISRAKSLLGWEPKVPVDVGLGATIDDFAARMAAGEE